MSIRVRTLAVKPCGCGFEGAIVFQLADSGIEVSCSYTSMNDETIEANYRIGVVTDAPIFLAFGVIKKTTKRQPSLRPILVGQFVGWETIDDDTYAMVAGPVRIPVDNELGAADLELKTGEWVECTGELMLGHRNEDG